MTLGSPFYCAGLFFSSAFMCVLYCGEILVRHRDSFAQEHTLKSKYSQIKNLVGILFENMETFWRQK